MKRLYPELLTQFIDIFTVDELLTNYPELQTKRQIPMHCIIWTGEKPFRHYAAGKSNLYDANTFICLAPDITQRFIKQQNINAQIILFSTEFFGGSFTETTLLESECLFSVTEACSYKNTICDAETFRKVFIRDLRKIYIEEYRQHHYLIARNILKRILLDGFRDYPAEINSHNYHHNIALQFKKLVNEHLADKRNISFYAQKLYISRRSLDHSIQIVYSKSPKEYILDTLVTRSKSLLVNTDLSIKEIADELGYAQESNFSAFFKNRIGITATAYRSMLEASALT